MRDRRAWWAIYVLNVICILIVKLIALLASLILFHRHQNEMTWKYNAINLFDRNISTDILLEQLIMVFILAYPLASTKFMFGLDEERLYTMLHILSDISERYTARFDLYGDIVMVMNTDPVLDLVDEERAQPFAVPMLPVVVQQASSINVVENENVHEKALRKAGYTGIIPDEFLCPIMRTIMVNPVISATGDKSANRSYDKTSIKVYKTNNQQNRLRDPINRKVITGGFIQNLDLKSAIENWVQKTVASCAQQRHEKMVKGKVDRQDFGGWVKTSFISDQSFFAKRAPKDIKDQNLQRCKSALTLS